MREEAPFIRVWFPEAAKLSTYQKILYYEVDRCSAQNCPYTRCKGCRFR